MVVVEYRAATLGDVSQGRRLVTLIAVPYDEPALVEFRGQPWEEIHLRGAYDEVLPGQAVNREHTRGDTVGRVDAWQPSRTEGLVAEVKIAKTPRGDDTLALAGEGMLRASVGFYLRSHADQRLNPALRRREITRASIEHLALVESPAFAGAKVLAVRHT